MTDRYSVGGKNAIPTTTPHNSSTPMSLDSLDAFENPSSTRDPLLVTTSVGEAKEEGHTETIIGSPGRQPSADLGPSMRTTQPIFLSPNSALLCRDTNPELPLFTETMCTEPGEQEPDHDHQDVNHDVSAGHRTVDYNPPHNVSGYDGGGYNAPPSLKTMSKHSFSTTSTLSNSDNGQKRSSSGYQSVDG